MAGKYKGIWYATCMWERYEVTLCTFSSRCSPPDHTYHCDNRHKVKLKMYEQRDEMYHLENGVYYENAREEVTK